MKNVDTALLRFKEGYSCSQAILSTYCEQHNLDRKLALKISSAFGGGMGGMGETCGAVTGAFMVIGLTQGGTDVKDKSASKRINASVREFVQRFKAKNGSIDCKDLLGLDPGTNKGVMFIKGKKRMASRCPGFVQDTIMIIDEILE